MKITLARHSGFCMGVRNALIRIVRELNSSREELYIYGPLIHNPQTIDVLNDRGLRTVTTIDDLAGKAVAIRTHGIPNDERLILRKCASRVINLTCPRVAKVQSIIKKHSSKGAHTVITGDRDHAEVKSLVSYAHHGATVISDIEETDSLPVADSYLVVSQTTFDRDLFLAIAGRISESIDDVTVFDTICDSTRLRQEDVVRGIFDGNDTLIVVGGKNSANTRRLAQIGRDRNILTFHIETEHELSIDDFRNAKNVLVTAGTSTPGWIINNVLDRLYTIDLGTRNLFLRSLMRFFEFAVRSNLISSAAAFFMTLTTLAYSGIPIDYTLPLISFLYIFSMYSINNLFEKKLLKFSNPFKYEIYRKYGSPLMALSIASMAASVLLAYHYNYATASLVAGACLLGIVYSSAPVKKLIRLLPFASLKSLYSSKTVTAFGWSIITVLVPMLATTVNTHALVSLFIFVFVLAFLRTAILDLIAFQGDLIFGRETLPLLIGTKRFFRFSLIFSAASAAVFAYITIILGGWAYLFLISHILYFLVLMGIIGRLNYLIALKYEVMVDLNLVLLIIFSTIMISMSSGMTLW